VYTDDDRLAAIATMVANVGGTPAPLPEWWPAGRGPLQGHNLRFAEPQAALLLSQLEIHGAQRDRREGQYEMLREAFPEDHEFPFELLVPAGEELLYKVGIRNDTSIPTGALQKALRIQLTAEVNPPYRPLSDPSGGLRLDTAPWLFDRLGVRLDPGYHFDAWTEAGELMMFSHDFFLRLHAAEQLLDALNVMAAHERALVSWAADQA
jgi:hypothetical protein